MPLELRPETEAYRLCQPMHVLSFGEGRWDWKRLCVCLRRFGMEARVSFGAGGAVREACDEK